MIRVIVELLPGGSSHMKRTLATMEISNVSDLARNSDYEVDISEEQNYLARSEAWSKTVHVRGHDRQQSIWKLIAAALSAADDP